MYSNNALVLVFVLILTLVATARAITWDPSFCSWEGTVPLCNSDCPMGNQFRCTTEQRSCFNGHKGLCCQDEKQAECCRVMNGLHPNLHDTLTKINPSYARQFYAECEAMRNNDQRH
ncbi:hypothetical protein BGZ97_011011 [Linnemannia gamsii]|uniref:Uncharacterized protein n=1 Tax=Linnemannia gamsii TaxID=64522 RepID=A0A9P6R4N7_9FUNG|nr:hypothetical protein BGZ97_011011 [Linnemannia gamsii]